MKFLLPLAALYDGITTLRNHLYNIQPKKTIHFTPFIISVGNLSAGGTGKTPMVAYLAEWLSKSYPLAILSRGYGRQTRGVRIAGEQDTARTLGDEPYLFYRRFANRPRVTVAVGEERVLAVPEIMQYAPDTEIILLDDAYQHRAIGRNFNILLTSYRRPFYDDYVLPAGRLRESRRGARRADAVIVTKCPDDLPESKQSQITHRVRAYTTPGTPVFFTGLCYSQSVSEVPTKTELTSSTPVVLFSGLADASLFEAYARTHFAVTEHITFGDHHRYTTRDQRQLAAALTKAGSMAALLTTEKDAVKFENTKLPIYYLPMQPYFLLSENQFHHLILSSIRTYAGA